MKFTEFIKSHIDHSRHVAAARDVGNIMEEMRLMFDEVASPRPRGRYRKIKAMIIKHREKLIKMYPEPEVTFRLPGTNGGLFAITPESIQESPADKAGEFIVYEVELSGDQTALKSYGDIWPGKGSKFLFRCKKNFHINL